MLSILLCLLYAGMVLSSSINQIQHGSMTQSDHGHVMLSDLSIGTLHVDVDHIDDRHSDHTGDSSTNSSEHSGGTHHHHGDTGSGVILHSMQNGTQFASLADTHRFAPDVSVPDGLLFGPERPPRTQTADV